MTYFRNTRSKQQCCHRLQQTFPLICDKVTKIKIRIFSSSFLHFFLLFFIPRFNTCKILETIDSLFNFKMFPNVLIFPQLFTRNFQTPSKFLGSLNLFHIFPNYPTYYNLLSIYSYHIIWIFISPKFSQPPLSIIGVILNPEQMTTWYDTINTGHALVAF